MVSINFTGVKKIIASSIERDTFADEVSENRAIEVFTEQGKCLITFQGHDLQFYQGEKEVKDEEGNH